MRKSEKDKHTVTPLGNYHPEIGRMLWMLEDARQRTKQAIEGAPHKIVDWSFSKQTNTIGSTLYHMAAIEMSWLFTEILEKGFPSEIDELLPYDVRDSDGQLNVVKGESLAEHIHRLDRTRWYLLESLKDMTLDRFRLSKIFEDYAVTPEWVIHHLIQHETEHRGQIMEIRMLAQVQ